MKTNKWLRMLSSSTRQQNVIWKWRSRVTSIKSEVGRITRRAGAHYAWKIESTQLARQQRRVSWQGGRVVREKRGTAQSGCALAAQEKTPRALLELLNSANLSACHRQRSAPSVLQQIVIVSTACFITFCDFISGWQSSQRGTCDAKFASAGVQPADKTGAHFSPGGALLPAGAAAFLNYLSRPLIYEAARIIFCARRPGAIMGSLYMYTRRGFSISPNERIMAGISARFLRDVSPASCRRTQHANAFDPLDLGFNRVCRICISPAHQGERQTADCGVAEPEGCLRARLLIKKLLLCEFLV